MSNWSVTYLDKDSGELEDMVVFDVATEEEARREADFSLGAAFKDWYEIKTVSVLKEA